MKSKEKGNIIFIHLFPGEEINEKIKEISVKHNITTAVLLSGIGQLKKVTIGYFKKRVIILQQLLKNHWKLFH